MTHEAPASRAWETVLQSIERDLLEGRLGPGDRLPGERELASRLGVGRSSVREALRVLEVMGLVRTATGSGPSSGAIIVARPGGGMSTLLRLQTAARAFAIDDVVATRVVLEESVARDLADAAADGRPHDLAAVRELLAAMDDDALTPGEFLALDARFHLGLAEAGDNTVTVAVMAGLRTAIEGYVQAGAAQIADWPATVARLRAEHARIVTAIEDGDRSGAVACMGEHIRGYFAQLRT